MDETFTRKKFEEFQNTDYDYLVIAERIEFGNTISAFDTIPCQGTLGWETIDDAIEYCLNNIWEAVYVFDLYSPFNKSLVKAKQKRINI